MRRTIGSSLLLVVFVGMLIGLGSAPASAHCSLGPFDAAIRFSDNVWAGEIVAGKKIDDDRTPYELTLRVDEVLSGEDPGPEAKILAQPCKKLNGIAPSTIADYVGLTGAFAIANVPTGYFYVETFQPEGDPIAAARTVLATDPFATPSPSTTAPPPVESATPSAEGSGSATIPLAIGAIVVVGIAAGVAFTARTRSRNAHEKSGPKKAPPQKTGQKAGQKRPASKKRPTKKRPAKSRR